MTTPLRTFSKTAELFKPYRKGDERAKEKGDKDEELAVGAGHPRIPIKQAGSQEYDLKNVDPQENS